LGVTPANPQQTGGPWRIRRAAEAARRLRQTLKTLDQSFTPTTPLDSEELWNELMASTGEVLVERHLLVA